MIRFALIVTLWATGASALTLDLPPPAQRSASDEETGAVTLPAASLPGDSDAVRQARGVINRTAWRLPGQGGRPGQSLAPVRAAIQDAGYEVVFECADTTCGGYEFRFALNLLPAPAMFVDLGNYHYLLAEHADGALVAILSSRAADTGYLHITHVRPGGAPPVDSIDVGEAVTDGPLWNRLRAAGRVALDELSFDTGSARLSGGPYGSLQALAEGLAADVSAQVTLVGHTDTSGGLDPNLALSRARAAAVRQTLIETHGADPARIAAEGVAYLAPRASNTSAEGRETNRRVEVVLTSP